MERLRKIKDEEEKATKGWLMFFVVMLLAVPLIMGMLAMTPAIAAESGPYLYGHVNDGSIIVKIDTGTGTIAEVVGPTGFPSTMSGMATCRGIVEGPDDVLYKPGTMFALLKEGDVDYLVVIDPTKTTELASIVVDIKGHIGGRGIAFDPDGSTLYLIGNQSDHLSIINTKTGVVTPVGPTGYTAASLEWDPKSELFYAISTPSTHGPANTLFGIDPATGQSYPRPNTVPPACTLVQSPIKMGSIWYIISGGQLYTVDIDTGTATVVSGSSGLATICGSAFAPERPRDIAPEQCKVTGGAEGEYEYRYDGDPIADHRISFGFTATTTGSPCVQKRLYGYVVSWPAKGQFNLVNHTTKEKIHGTFEGIVSEPGGFGAPGYAPWIRLAWGKCTLDGQVYHLALEVRDNGEPGVDDFVVIELIEPGEPGEPANIIHAWYGRLDGGNFQVKCKGPEAELVKCPDPEPPE